MRANVIHALTRPRLPQQLDWVWGTQRVGFVAERCDQYRICVFSVLTTHRADADLRAKPIDRAAVGSAVIILEADMQNDTKADTTPPADARTHKLVLR